MKNYPEHITFYSESELTEIEKEVIYMIHIVTLAKNSKPTNETEPFNINEEIKRISKIYENPTNPASIDVNPDLLKYIRDEK